MPGERGMGGGGGLSQAGGEEQSKCMCSQERLVGRGRVSVCIHVVCVARRGGKEGELRPHLT